MLGKLLGAIGLGGSGSEPKFSNTASGLKVWDEKVGDGEKAEPNRTVTLHYTGWIYAEGKATRMFDSSRSRKEPFSFVLGTGKVIKGWDEGVRYMKVGGKRWIIVPPYLGYANNGMGRIIPPGATLMFELELLAVR